MKYIMFYESFPFDQSLKIGDYVELIDDDEGRLKGYWQIEDIKLDTFNKNKTGCTYNLTYDLIQGNNILPSDGKNLRKVPEEEYLAKKFNL